MLSEPTLDRLNELKLTGMAQAFAGAVEAGRLGYEAGLMAPRDLASHSTPILGTPFWQQENQQA